jgi:hypothetical protein
MTTAELTAIARDVAERMEATAQRLRDVRRLVERRRRCSDDEFEEGSARAVPRSEREVTP